MSVSVEQRIEALKEFCARRDWPLSIVNATQREPISVVAISVGAVGLRAQSADSIDVALARIERALQELSAAHPDAYFHEPHREMGRVSRGPRT